MNSAQLTLKEITDAFKRRWKLIMISVFIVGGLSTGLAYWLPPKYASSMTILVEEDKTLNPLISYRMAVNMASEDRLKSFNEIIYSRPAIEAMIDTLGLKKQLKKEDMGMDKLVEKVKGNIRTSLKASDSFSLTYYSSEPALSKRGVSFLSNYFIEKKTKMENRSNKQTVQFFEEKVSELKQEVDKRKDEVLEIDKEQVNTVPTPKADLQSRLNDLNQDIEEIDLKISKMKTQLSVFESFPSEIKGSESLNELAALNFSSVPKGERLESLLNEYQTLRNKYTGQYPKLQQVESKILTLVRSIPSTIRSDINTQQALKQELVNQRQQIASKIEKVTVDKTQHEDEKSGYAIYKDMYDKMKVKLEQARTTRDLGNESSSQFIVLEPPVIPEDPAKPNKLLLIAGGFAAGILLGIITAGLAELMDTTIRKPTDVKPYVKPVIAYVPKASTLD